MTEDAVKTYRRDPQYSHLVADMYACVGMKDEALDWLENAMDRGWIHYQFSVLQDPLLAPFRDEPRFRKIGARMKREWEEFGRELEEDGVQNS